MYNILTAYDKLALENLVNDALLEGATLVGGIANSYSPETEYKYATKIWAQAVLWPAEKVEVTIK